jgi:hypothetical protein
MNLRLGAYFAAAVFLAACQGLSNSNPSSVLPTQNLQAKSPAAKATPSYLMSIVLPDSAIRPQLQENVGSVRATTYVKKKKYGPELIKAPLDCELYTSSSFGHGKVGGCNVLFAGSQELDIKSATFDVYKAADGKGCIMAKASFKGDAVDGTTVASSYKPENTKTCW